MTFHITSNVWKLRQKPPYSRGTWDPAGSRGTGRDAGLKFISRDPAGLRGIKIVPSSRGTEQKFWGIVKNKKNLKK